MNWDIEQIKKAMKQAVALSEAAIIGAIAALVVGAAAIAIALFAYFK